MIEFMEFNTEERAKLADELQIVANDLHDKYGPEGLFDLIQMFNVMIDNDLRLEEF